MGSYINGYIKSYVHEFLKRPRQTDRTLLLDQLSYTYFLVILYYWSFKKSTHIVWFIMIYEWKKSTKIWMLFIVVLKYEILLLFTVQNKYFDYLLNKYKKVIFKLQSFWHSTIKNTIGCWLCFEDILFLKCMHQSKLIILKLHTVVKTGWYDVTIEIMLLWKPSVCWCVHTHTHTHTLIN